MRIVLEAHGPSIHRAAGADRFFPCFLVHPCQHEYLPGRGLKLTTLDGYRQTLRNHLLPFFGHIPLAELEQRPELVDRYIAQKMQQGLSPSQVGIGVPASTSAAGGGFVSPSVVNAAMNCLKSGTSCGFKPPQTWPAGVRGAMTWSTNWDGSSGFAWVNGITVP